MYEYLKEMLSWSSLKTSFICKNCYWNVMKVLYPILAGAPGVARVNKVSISQKTL